MRALIGRRDELTKVEEALSGDSRMVLITGDAGIGKSHLIWEATRLARQSGAITMTAGCLPLVEKLSLLPIIDLLRDLSRHAGGRILTDASARLPASARRELARVVPQLSSSDHPNEHDEPGNQPWLFGAIVELLEQITGAGPVVLVIEDIHWADTTTLDFLTYLHAATVDPRCTTVVSYRSDDPATGDHLPEWLNHAARARDMAMIMLGPLSPQDLAEQAASILQRPAPVTLVNELFARTEGNPFYAEQLVSAALEGHGADAPALPRELPISLARLLVSRVPDAGEPARDVVATMAIAARPLTETQLAELTELSLPTVRAALRQLAVASLLAPGGDTSLYRPRHALLAEAVLAALLPWEKVVLHARIAEAWTAATDPDLAAEIAGHWAAAGRPAEELPATVDAAEAHERVFAFPRAAALWHRAIELSEQLPERSRELALDPAALRIRAVDALVACGRFVEAEAIAEETYRLYAHHNDSKIQARVHARTAYFRAMEDPGAAKPIYEHAVRLFEDTAPSAEYANLLQRYASVMQRKGSSEQSGHILEKALTIAETAGATASQVRILSCLSTSRLVRGEVDEGFALLRRARHLADFLRNTSCDVDPSTWVAVFESDALCEIGRLEAAANIALEAARRATDGGRGMGFGATLLNANACYALLELGEVQRAATLIDPLTDAQPNRDDWLLHELRIRVDLCRGKMNEAVRRLTAVRSLAIGGSIQFARDLAQDVAAVYLAVTQPRRALDHVLENLDRLRGSDQELYSGELLVLGARAAADLFVEARARADKAGQRAADDGMKKLVATLEDMHGRPLMDHPCISRISGDRADWTAELARATGTDDPDTWDAAAMAWQRLGRPHRAAYAQWREVQARLAQGARPRDVADLLRAAAAAASNMRPLEWAIETLAARSRITLNQSSSSTTPALRPPDPYGLTARERLVLQLAAKGRTNAEIGAELFISPKTASVHMTNILRKLNVATRIQAAAVADLAGLLDDNT
jgi:DNA-binding CsgD family transcriptional regulator/tetratricopeptide (TPR) repeat protein